MQGQGTCRSNSQSDLRTNFGQTLDPLEHPDVRHVWTGTPIHGIVLDDPDNCDLMGIRLMGRQEQPLDLDGSPVRELARWLRDLRNQSGMTYQQLALRSKFSRATLQEALAGRRLPTLPVTLAVVQACGGDTEAWRTYWGQVRRATDRDAPTGDEGPIVPPWIERPTWTGAVTRAAASHEDIGLTVAINPILGIVRRPVLLYGLSAAGLVAAVVLAAVLVRNSSPSPGSTRPSA
jgi:transcriptional regulator with XRE-family HTH domain